MKRIALLFVLIGGLALGVGCGPNRVVHRPPPPEGMDQDKGSHGGGVLQNDPDRLDLRLRQARLDRARGDFEAEYGLWVQTLQLADRPSHHFHWENGAAPPQRPSRLIYSDLQASIDHYLASDNEEDTARALRLSKLGATYLPERKSFERDRAVCYSRRGDPKAAMKCLLRLLEKDPQDKATLRIIGDVLEKAGKEKEAGIYRRKAAELSGPDREGGEKDGRIPTF